MTERKMTKRKTKRLERLERIRKDLFDEPHPYRTLMEILELMIADEKDKL